jgi:hypothetical protein
MRKKRQLCARDYKNVFINIQNDDYVLAIIKIFFVKMQKRQLCARDYKNIFINIQNDDYVLAIIKIFFVITLCVVLSPSCPLLLVVARSVFRDEAIQSLCYPRD